MKNILKISLLCVAITMPLACDHIFLNHMVSHTENDTTGWFGGKTHEVNTTYKNDDGSTSVETETATVDGNTTTIVRERKTTGADGSVKNEYEKHIIVKGSESVVKESKSAN